MSTRKRIRHSPPNDPEQDELSPSKHNTGDTEILGPLKRRKLNTYGSTTLSKRSEEKGILGRLSGLLGLGSRKGKENHEVDELSGGGDVDRPGKDIWDVPEETIKVANKKGTRSRKPAGNTQSTKEKDIWEIEVSGSGDDAETQSYTRAKNDKTATPKPISKLQQIGKEVDITPKRSGGRPKRTEPEVTPQHTSKKSPPEGGNTLLAKRSSGRVRKSDILKKAKAISRQAVRQRMSRPGFDDSEEEQINIGGITKRESSQMSKSEAANSKMGPTDPTHVPRKRGRPRKELNNGASPSKSPKSILTPSKGKSGRPRKSVLFKESGDIDLGFKDIPDSPGAKASKPTGRLPKSNADIKNSEGSLNEPIDDDVDSDDDDVACTVCNGLDSEEPNEILFCDNCDNAYHQICYGVLVVPEGDWLCKDCRPDVDDSLGLGEHVIASSSNTIPPIAGFEDHLQSLQRVLLDKLTGRRRIKLIGHDEEMQKVSQVVEQTILAGEGNSMLVIGARGCGKTNLVESVISDLSIEHRENFHVIRLNGFIHTDDKLALKEIWRQLGREMDINDEFTAKSNHADTLASLLALLSHPSEISENQENQTAKSVVFILDEFDLFTTHPRQTLLYNLFDIAQARKAPIVVLGLTTRVDVVEALEKRVKSRFSHRYVHLSLPRNIPAFWEICKAALICDSEELDRAGFNTKVDGLDAFLSLWKSTIEDLYNGDAVFKHHLQSQFYRTKSVSGFLSSCILSVANISLKDPFLTGRSFTSASVSLAAPDSKLHILQGLSELELALLIAAARLDIILDTDTCNFAMAYDEYSTLTSRHKIQTSSTGIAALGASAKVWGRDVALGAWERLAAYDLLVSPGIGGGSARDFGAGGRMWKVDVGLEEITGSVDGLSGVMVKWCREI